MDQVNVSEDGHITSVDTGAHWGKVYEYLGLYNATVNGGGSLRSELGVWQPKPTICMTYDS